MILQKVLKILKLRNVQTAQNEPSYIPHFEESEKYYLILRNGIS